MVEMIHVSADGLGAFPAFIELDCIVAWKFWWITSLDGIRYAVRPQSVGIIHDADECRDETLVQLHGGLPSREARL